MLAPAFPVDRQESEEQFAPRRPLPSELEFYRDYAWCLNPHPTVGEATEFLRGEIGKFGIAPSGWQTQEVATNVFLLACALLNSVDEHLRGPTLRVPRKLAATSLGRGGKWAVETIWANRRGLAQVRRWRESWLSGLNDFLSVLVAGAASDPAALAELGGKLALLLESPPPADLQAQQIAVPSPFSRLDLTHFDVLALGQRFMRRFPDRSRAILIVGLRTSGSYFAPLLRAFLEAEGYATAPLLTMEPNKGLGRWESRELEHYAQQGYTALIVDDPPHTAGTIFVALDIARRAGFATDKLKVLVPVHPAKRNWSKQLPDGLVVSLEPEQWRMRSLLDAKAVEKRLAEYFSSENFVDVSVVESRRAEEYNARMQHASRESRGSRLKRIFEVRLKTPHGGEETRFVLAKSVGWGWLGYHAFLAGQRLSGFVPPILGLRDGILYMEWIPQSSLDDDDSERRAERIDVSASYVATRVRALYLESNPLLGKGQQRHHNGFRLLEKTLSRAYGRLLTDTLMQGRIGRRLRQQPCPFPTLIDGAMARGEWIEGPNGPLKTDYEHHGMGKAELNVIDPAYDLADSIFSLSLLPDEESRLIRRYVEVTGDVGVEQRLFIYKLLAGLWAMEQAQDHLFGKSRSANEQLEFHRQFMSAWNFLTVQAARRCGGRCLPPAQPGWRAPLVALDIDGVLDRRTFGFPCTTEAGIKALSLLHAHGFSVAVNTARSAAEVKDYCDAYSLAGGVAEHGGYLWDAVAQRGRVLVGAESMRQLDELRENLRRLPGVFLDERHQYSIRAFTYQDKPSGLIASLSKSMHSSHVGDGALAPLPTLAIQQLMTELKLDRLSFHQTMIDTTIVAKEVDKGVGLLALRDWVLGPEAETIAVGDSEPDLTMFRVATRSYAPANISCASQARLLGCRIVHNPHQRGLLDIARALAHPDGQRDQRGVEGETIRGASDDDLFAELLRAADQRWSRRLINALFDPAAFKIFVR
jgi:hydroxymethylpyrimidine pyrophosphatase-like HAD family hydrolase